ncbi:uncharacterized protein LOC132197892 [Neocloeon triangulifer]|uniref:uncharacterized protein LOC132197892 n=1 Tax=Neocloeon triangulifer TaxID=2078957 RepID=UPI00286F00C7|nr:uncharacterized protein LOC132197892 [Neocloeon triangulifer]XP_059477472.1 uncharacterized protein LOC132197892 [Neocloeon triangulifer]
MRTGRYKYGCFSAFFFAEIREMEGQICISVGEKERRTLGELTHGLLGVQNDDWIGKPKLLFLIDQNCVATDQQPTTRRITPRIKSQRVLGATNHNGWFVVVLRNRSSHFLEQFIKVFENQKLKDKQSSLQELVGELLTTSNDDSGNTVTIVSTLAHLLSFPDLEQNFFHPHFELDGNTERFESIISRARFIYRTSMWLLTSAPGSGKTTMFREILFRMQRAVNSDVKVYLIFLVRVSHLFHAAKSKRQTEPSLASIVAHVSGNLEEDIQNLIDTKKIVLMFDGFDEISKNYGAEVLKIFAEALKQEVTIWVSTRQHEEDAILQHVDQKVDIRRIKICPLSDTEQIRFLMILSQKSFHDCKLKIKLYERNGHEDVLKSPLHLKMIAELDDSAVIEKFDLYDIYENVVDQQLRLTLTLFKEGTLAYEKARDSIFKDLKGISADFLSTGTTATKLKNINNGLATITNGHVRFVHQTFAEFFAATYFIDCLFDDLEMPFDIFRDEFRGVRKFVDLRISIEKQSSKVFAVLEKHLNETLTRQILFKIIWDERLGAFSYASSRLVSLVESSKLNFMYSDIDYIMEKASEYSEIFAVEILEKGAFSKFKWPEDTAAKMLINAIEKNFASLLLKLEEKVENLKLLAQRDKKRLYKAVRLGIKWNNHEVLKLVLEKEYTEHTEEFMGAHLELAVRHCSAECVEHLIDHGAHTTDLYEFQDLDQYTASALLKTKEETLPKLAAEIFTVALESKNVEAAMAVHDRFVNNKMADFDISNRALYEVIQWNRYPEEVEVLCRWLVERCGFDIYDHAAMGCNALHCAAQYGHHGLVKYFLEKDPNLIESMTESQCDVLCHTIFGFKGSKDFYPPDFEFIEEIIICPGIQQIISVLDTLHTYNSEMIKRKSDGDKTLLHMVLERFHFERFEICKWLIENGVDVEAADDRGWNAFHYFTRANMAENDDRGKRDLNMIISLLSETIPECVKQRTKKGETVLHFAAKSNHIGVTDFEWLASQQGLELGDVDHRGWNVLHFAMHDTDMAGWFCNESEEKMRFILETQPSLLQSVTESGEKIMHFIANNKDHHGRTLKYMKFVHNLDKELVSQKTASNKTVLHYAAGSGNMKLCQWLLDEVGLEVDAVDDESCNVIHHAAVHSNVDLQLLKYLHEKNPQLIHKRTNRHQTVLHLVARNEKLSVCQWLVDEIGLAVDALDAERWNAVHYASYNTTYRLDFIKYFHEKNPDVIRQKTKKNQTMLHLAAERGNLQVCEWLSEEIGLEVDAEDDDGWNVMHFDTYNTSYDLRLIKYLHRKNPHLVKKKTNRNQTVLLLAVKNDLLEKCKWLVEEAGAEVDAVDDEGWNVFHYAASYIHDSKTGKLSAVEMFEYLLLNSPSCLLKKKTNRNETALHLVAKNESGLRPKERYEWLVSAGVDASELDVDGKTAMQVASQHFISRYNNICFNKNEWYN